MSQKYRVEITGEKPQVEAALTAVEHMVLTAAVPMDDTNLSVSVSAVEEPQEQASEPVVQFGGH